MQVRAFGRYIPLTGLLEAVKPLLTQTANGANKKLVLHVRLWFGSLSITTTVPLLANKFDVRSVLQGQVRLAAVNQN